MWWRVEDLPSALPPSPPPPKLPSFSNPCPGKPPSQFHLPARAPRWWGLGTTGEEVVGKGFVLRFWYATASFHPTHNSCLNFPICLACTNSYLYLLVRYRSVCVCEGQDLLLHSGGLTASGLPSFCLTLQL